MEKPILTTIQTPIPRFDYWVQKVLPNVYDDSLSYYELLTKVVKHLNDVGALTNEVVALWNDVSEWIMNEGLKDTLELTLDEWVYSGKMSDIINNRVFSDLLNYTKDNIADIRGSYRRNDMLITMGDLSQDVKTGLTGGAVAVTGVDSVSKININRDTISPYELAVVKKTNNLFILDSFTPNKSISVGDGVTLNESSSVGYSDWIRVVPSSTIYKNKEGGLILYDENQTRVTSYNMSTAPQSLVLPSNVHYIRANIYIKDIYEYQLEYGTVGTTYQKGVFTLDKSVKIKDDNIDNVHGSKINYGSVPLDVLENMVKSPNILNLSKAQNGYVNRSNGSIVDGAGNTAFAMIPIMDSQFRVSPITTGAVNIMFYNDERYIYNSGVQLFSDTTNWVVDVPTDAKYFSISFHESEISKAIVSWGSAVVPYEPYYLFSKDMVYPSTTGDGGVEQTLTVNRTPDRIRIYIPQDGNKSIEYNFIKESKSYTDGKPYQFYNGWRLHVSNLIEYNDDVEISRKQIVTGGAWECAISVEGYADFMGTYHGYEQMKNLYVYVDNVAFSEGVTQGEKVSFIYTSDIYEQGSNSIVAAEVVRIYTFTKDGLTLYQKYNWKKGYTVKRGFITMLPIERTGVTHTALNDYDYIEYDVSQGGTNHPINAYREGVKRTYIYGDEVGAEVFVQFKNESVPFRANVSSAEQYNKLYYAYSYDTPVKVGDVWEVTTTYDIKSV